MVSASFRPHEENDKLLKWWRLRDSPTKPHENLMLEFLGAWEHGICALHDLVRHEAPKIFLLQESKLIAKKMEAVKFKLGFTCCLGFDCKGRGWGWALLWDSKTDFILYNFSNSHIQAEIKEGNLSWLFTGLYSHLVPAWRRETWTLLKMLRPEEGHWSLVGVDFSELLNNKEKWGGNPRLENQMRRFKTTLDECHLQDLGFSSKPYMWCNGREEDDNVNEWLNKEWQFQFQTWHVHH